MHLQATQIKPRCTNLPLQSKLVFSVEELLHHQPEPNVSRQVTRGTLQSSGVAVGSTLEKVKGSLPLRVVGVFPCKLDREIFKYR